jgi:hypothetical protein
MAEEGYVKAGFDLLLWAAFKVSLSCPAEFQKQTVKYCISAAETYMNILLQNKRTLNYVEGVTGWTTKHEKARVFGTGIEALFFCFNRHIKNMQILGEFVNARLNFIVPVTDLRGD